MPVALVTGTSTGIGFATALHLARHGHRVVATMRNLGEGRPARGGGGPRAPAARRARARRHRQDSVDRAVAATRDGEGPIDVLVNNAGIGGATPLELTPEDEHRAMFETNYWGPSACIQAVLPSMRERRAGASSTSPRSRGGWPTPNQIAYSASKCALAAASEALAHEVAASASGWRSSSPASSRPRSSRTRPARPATTRPRRTSRSCGATASSSRPASATRASRRRWRRRSSRPSPRPTAAALAGRRRRGGLRRRARPHQRRGVGRDGRGAHRRGVQRAVQRYFGIEL